MPTASRLLTPRQDELVRHVRRALDDLRAALVRAGARAEDERTVRASSAQLDDFFLLVVVGEFNAGKSALVNALVGAPVLAEGVTPTTTHVQVLRHTSQADAAAAEGLAAGDPEVRSVSADAPLLLDMHVVDTPGTNAIVREHEVLTRRFIPRADLILFVASADRPLTESERQFLQQIREWGKKIVIAVNKADLLATPGDLEAVCTFVRDNVRALLGFAPELFAVSARQALAAKAAGDAEALQRSQFPALESYVRTTLHAGERFRLKLMNPIGVGRRLAGEYRTLVGSRLALLDEDTATVAEIRSGLDGFRREMTRGFELRLAEVDNLLRQFEQRGDAFFEDTVRVGRIFDLMNRSRIQLEFERTVIGDLPKHIEERVAGFIDWLVASDLQQWAEVRDRLARRRSEHAERVAGRLAGGFDYDRARLLDTVGKAAQDTLDAHDQRAEAARMAQSVQMAVANAALLQAGAVGLGTAVSLIATSTAADVTGLLAAGVLATVGFIVIPYRRKTARRELHARLARLREQLMGALTTQFHKEIERSIRRVEDGIAPYVQFVEGERASLAARQEELAAIDGRLARLATDVEAA
ncbi:MAG: dynamin family protein [Vicinamibacterales bacterium]